MPGDDVPVLVNEHGYVEAKNGDAGGNLSDLLVVVLPRIQRIGVNRVYWTVLDGKADKLL